MSRPAAALSSATGHDNETVYTLGRRRIFILPTRQGLGFGFALALMLAGAMNYENSLGYFMTFQLGAVGLLSIVFAFRDLFGLQVQITACPPVFSGETASFTVHIDNHDGRQRFGVLVRRDPKRGTEAYNPDATASQTIVVRVAIAAGQTQQARLGLTAPQRGWLTLDGVSLASRHPFGLFRAWAPIRVPARALVYPRPSGNQPLPAPQGLMHANAGAQGGAEDDFAGLRAFRRGDTPKHVHWKAAARDETLPVKVFAGGQGGTLLLSYSQVLATDPEEKIAQLCRWVLDADEAGIRYALELPNQQLTSERCLNMRRECLTALALFSGEAQPATHLQAPPFVLPPDVQNFARAAAVAAVRGDEQASSSRYRQPITAACRETDATGGS